jgi:hypothetical protein
MNKNIIIGIVGLVAVGGYFVYKKMGKSTGQPKGLPDVKSTQTYRDPVKAKKSKSSKQIANDLAKKMQEIMWDNSKKTEYNNLKNKLDNMGYYEQNGKAIEIVDLPTMDPNNVVAGGIPTTYSVPSGSIPSGIVVSGSAVVSNYVGFDGAINSKFLNY